MLDTLFLRMQDKACDCHTIPVVVDTRLIGLLTMENIGEFLMIQSAMSAMPPGSRSSRADSRYRLHHAVGRETIAAPNTKSSEESDESMLDEATQSRARPLVLLTGATGYIGGRLLRRLVESGYPVRCLTRRPEALQAKIGDQVEAVAGDVLDRESLMEPMQGVSVAYYLVHSMGSTGDFEAQDRQAAENFGQAASEAGVESIIYLGGLGESDEELSSHLRSRQEVGELLRQSGVPVVELRASIILGSGSLSFEMIRALVERLPVMITPRWVSVAAQPIAVEDVLQYLLESLEIPLEGSATFEIGGTDQVSYGELMREYARQRGLPRVMIRVPVLTPRLSSLWLGLVTPLYARVGRKLAESLKHPTVVRDTSADKVFRVRPVGVREAIARALRHEDGEFAETRWSDALSSSGSTPDWGGVRFGNRLVDSHTAHVSVPPEVAFAPIQRIGGERGWYYANALWKLRGFLDLLVGGVGVRRGRRDPELLRVGDALDFWRVEAFEPPRLLRLAAEMKLPGRAWQEFEVTGDDTGSTIRQTAIFDPAGLSGLAYWYLVYPLHGLVFGGMLRRIVALCERESNAS